ncbi:MAG: ATP-binding cassette domain-containing protein [Planctomycetes bacterium]|nr:ATP-binding cassette domain-containing protein [Planctomycetota bacterium]
METLNENFVVTSRNVSKKFGKNQVLNQINFDLPAGVIYGISGPNGTGKSVFLRILTGLILPDNGEVTIYGKKIGKETEFAPSTGILIDSPGFLLANSGRRNLQLLASVSGKVSEARIVEAIQQVGLNPEDRRPVSTYSTGMRQRLGLAQAIMEDPNLLILDEPTTGLDFDGQREIYSYLVDLRAQGKTILITSHSRDELKILCDEIFILSSGKLTRLNATDKQS